MYPTFAKKQDFTLQPINFYPQKINDIIFTIYRIVIVVFLMTG